MMNYTKSEFYRIFITKEIYTAAGLLAGIALLLNIALYFFGNSYANTSFSYFNKRTKKNTGTNLGIGLWLRASWYRAFQGKYL